MNREPVRCPKCDRPQPDRGKHRTCVHCGTSPLPSVDYGRESAFHPKERIKTPTVRQLVTEIRRRRAER